MRVGVAKETLGAAEGAGAIGFALDLHNDGQVS